MRISDWSSDVCSSDLLVIILVSCRHHYNNQTMLKLSHTRLACYLLLTLTLASCSAKEAEPEWIQLFNGKDLNDWTIKIRGHELNDNYGNTFRVEDGVMKVGYEAYEDFKQQYGHIYYKEPFSAYLLSVEYRFTGEQAPGGEGWAIRNSGAMLHRSEEHTSELQSLMRITYA